VTDHRDQSEAVVRHVNISVAAARWTVRAAHVLGEDPPRLDPSHHVDTHVAVERRADVVGPHGRRDTHRGRLVPAPRVEAPGDLPLAVENVAALLDAAGEEHVAIDAEQVLAVEARLAHLLQRADRLGFARNRHALSHCTACPGAAGPRYARPDGPGR
jgi:hypothetical protein